MELSIVGDAVGYIHCSVQGVLAGVTEAIAFGSACFLSVGKMGEAESGNESLLVISTVPLAPHGAKETMVTCNTTICCAYRIELRDLHRRPPNKRTIPRTSMPPQVTPNPQCLLCLQP